MVRNWEEARDKLRSWREENSRHSEDVTVLWSDWLERNKQKLGDEEWMILEQVFIAALDCGKLDLADQCFAALSEQFPGSVRVLKLKGLRLETLERYDDAVAIYDSILREEENNSTARKRKVAVYRSQGRIHDAIKELIEYLTKFMSDCEAWMELSDLYLKEGDYCKAAYCMEELILFNPHSHLFYERFAEIKYTQGGFDNLECARQYFCMSAKLNPKNIRAHYGIVLCCASAMVSPKLTAQKKKEVQKLSEWAQKRILERYEEKDGGSSDVETLQDSFSRILNVSEKSH